MNPRPPKSPLTEETPAFSSSQCEPLTQVGNLHVKLTRLDDRLVVRTDERQIFTAQLECQRATLPGLQIYFRESSQPATGRRQRRNQIADVELHDLFTRTLTSIRNGDVNGKFVVGAHRLLV